jgi:very-short-patch-repair endonuclease
MDDRTMFYGAGRGIFRNARLLRHKETDEEKLLWQRLCRNQLCGYRFKRQHPIADYVADFYCHKLKLVIEIDGASHNQSEQIFYDEIRTRVMNEFGLRVLRFSNEEVFHNIDQVIETIKSNMSANL